MVGHVELLKMDKDDVQHQDAKARRKPLPRAHAGRRERLLLEVVQPRSLLRSSVLAAADTRGPSSRNEHTDRTGSTRCSPCLDFSVANRLLFVSSCLRGE